MRHTVTGLVEKPVEAQQIIDELMARCLSDRSDISLIAQDDAGQASRLFAGAVHAAGQVAGAAGTAAAATGSAAMEFASAVTREVPGFGVLRAIGRLGASLSRTALATAEDLAKTLVDFGFEQSLAQSYADALREGRILIVVDAKTENMARCARQVMAARGAVMPDVTGEAPAR
jgi:hypothetical protein